MFRSLREERPAFCTQGFKSSIPLRVQNYRPVSTIHAGKVPAGKMRVNIGVRVLEGNAEAYPGLALDVGGAWVERFNEDEPTALAVISNLHFGAAKTRSKLVYPSAATQKRPPAAT